MSGITAVYIAFLIVLATLFAFAFLMSRRQKDLEAEIEDLKETIEAAKAGPARGASARSGQKAELADQRKPR